MDETSLFYSDTTHKTYIEKEADCTGGKCLKERITVALCASMMGKFLRKFINIRIDVVLVVYIDVYSSPPGARLSCVCMAH